MRRDKLKYEVYSHYDIFSWKECFACAKEFRREKGFRIWEFKGFSYICASCACSKESAIAAYDAGIARMRGMAPICPPPKR